MFEASALRIDKLTGMSIVALDIRHGPVDVTPIVDFMDLVLFSRRDVHLVSSPLAELRKRNEGL